MIPNDIEIDALLKRLHLANARRSWATSWLEQRNRSGLTETFSDSSWPKRLPTVDKPASSAASVWPDSPS